MITRQTFWQFARYCAVGGVNTLVNFGTYVALTRGLTGFLRGHLDAANTVAYVVAVASSLVLNNFWTFDKDSRDLAGRTARFLLVALGALIWNAVLFWVLTRADVYDLAAKIAASVVVVAWNFTLYKHWVFVDRPSELVPAEALPDEDSASDAL